MALLTFPDLHNIQTTITYYLGIGIATYLAKKNTNGTKYIQLVLQQAVSTWRHSFVYLSSNPNEKRMDKQKLSCNHVLPASGSALQKHQLPYLYTGCNIRNFSRSFFLLGSIMGQGRQGRSRSFRRFQSLPGNSRDCLQSTRKFN